MKKRTNAHGFGLYKKEGSLFVGNNFKMRKVSLEFQSLFIYLILLLCSNVLPLFSYTQTLAKLEQFSTLIDTPNICSIIQLSQTTFGIWEWQHLTVFGGARLFFMHYIIIEIEKRECAEKEGKMIFWLSVELRALTWIVCSNVADDYEPNVLFMYSH